MKKDYEVILPDCFDERAEYEMTLRGYLTGINVIGEDGKKHPVSIFDIVRVQQELQDDAQDGRPFFTEPGLIIVTEVTMQSIMQAIDELWTEGFFR